MALSLLECTGILKIVNTSFGNLPRSGLLEPAAARDARKLAPLSSALGHKEVSTMLTYTPKRKTNNDWE